MTNLEPIPMAVCDPNAHIYTSGYMFQDSVIYHCPKTTVTISTYNVSTNIVNNFVDKLCKRATEVTLLVGINPFHHNNFAIVRQLSEWKVKHPNIRIYTASKLHVKAVLIERPRSLIGWAGSLNLITPTLNDLMVRLSKRQAVEVKTYLQKLEVNATLLQ